MRLALELLVLVVLIALGWEKSFHQSLGEVPLIGTYLAAAKPEQSRSSSRDAPAPTPSASPPGAWMWDPKRKSVLDRPGQTATPPTSFTGHIWYTDETGKKYWLNAQGQRHYEP